MRDLCHLRYSRNTEVRYSHIDSRSLRKLACYGCFPFGVCRLVEVTAVWRMKSIDETAQG